MLFLCLEFPLLKSYPSKIKFICHFFHKPTQNSSSWNWCVSLSHLSQLYLIEILFQLFFVSLLWHQSNTTLYCCFFLHYEHTKKDPHNCWHMSYIYIEPLVNICEVLNGYSEKNKQVCRDDSIYVGGDKCHGKVCKNI